MTVADQKPGGPPQPLSQPTKPPEERCDEDDQCNSNSFQPSFFSDWPASSGPLQPTTSLTPSRPFNNASNNSIRKCASSNAKTNWSKTPPRRNPRRRPAS